MNSTNDQIRDWSLLPPTTPQHQKIATLEIAPQKQVKESHQRPESTLIANLNKRKSNRFGESCQKVSIITVTILVIVAAWASLIISGFVFTIKYDVEGDKRLNASAAVIFSDSYPESYVAAIDQLNLTIECPDNFINNGSHCTIDRPFCDRWHPAGRIAIPITNVGISILIAFGFLISVISFTSFVASTYSASSVSFATIRTRAKKLFDSLITPSMISLYISAIFCIFLFLIFDLVPNPNQSYCKPFRNSSTDNVLFQLYGTLFQYAIMSFFFWVNFILLNLLLTLSFPFAFHTKLRLKVVIYTIECVIGITVPIFLACLTLALGKGMPHRGYEYIRLIAVQAGTNSLSALIVYYAPVVLSILSILTLTPILICRLRWNHFTIKKGVGDHAKISSLEYRIVLYSIAEFVILITMIISLIFFIKISKSQLFAEPPHIELCATSLSSAFYHRNNTTTRFSSVIQAYDEFVTDSNSSQVSSVFLESCMRIGRTNKVFPPVFYVIDGFLLRILIICIFIFTLPSKANYDVWKKFFLFAFKGLQTKLKSSVKSTDLS